MEIVQLFGSSGEWVADERMSAKGDPAAVIGRILGSNWV
jgi:hypothetical protein